MLIDSVVRSILWLGMFVGIIMILNPLFKTFVTKNKYRANEMRKKVAKNVVSKHIERLLSTTLNRSDAYAVTVFYIVTFAFLFFSGLAVYRAGLGMGQKIFVPIVAAAIPYITLWFRLYTVRIESSYEGDIVVKALLNNYKIHYKNMYEAIDYTIMEIPKNFFARRALLKLSLKLRGAKDEEEIADVIYDFNFSIDTQWSLDLSNAILISITQDYDVTPSLVDIQRKFKTLKEITEQQKRYNHEGYLIAKWLTPAMYTFTVLAMIYYLGLSFEEYIDKQFFHPLGLKFGIYTILSMLIGYGLYFFTRRPKNDF